jgi:hypothetical protein
MVTAAVTIRKSGTGMRARQHQQRIGQLAFERGEASVPHPFEVAPRNRQRGRQRCQRNDRAAAQHECEAGQQQHCKQGPSDDALAVHEYECVRERLFDIARDALRALRERGTAGTREQPDRSEGTGERHRENDHQVHSDSFIRCA